MPEKVYRLCSIEVGPREAEESRVVGDANGALDQEGARLVSKKSQVLDIFGTEYFVAEERLLVE